MSHREVGQLEQDTSTTPDTDSGTNRTADDVEATADPSVGGEGPEQAAMHLTDDPPMGDGDGYVD